MHSFLLDIHRLWGVIEGGRLSHFLPRWLRAGWQRVISQGIIPPRLGIQPELRRGQAVRYIRSPIVLYTKVIYLPTCTGVASNQKRRFARLRPGVSM